MKGTKKKTVFKEMLCLNSYISIIDDSSVLVENCRSINECNEIMVRVSTKENDVEIWGSELKVTNYTNTSMLVEGRINSVNVTRKSSRV